jgi:aubergine-like protein
MFTSRKLDRDFMELVGKRHDESVVKITIKYVQEISMTDGQSMQILNLILRKAMEGLNLQLVGRNFFDAASKIGIQEFKLELWPGYVTSIRQHEQEILLCCEISHKVMRMVTAMDILKNLASNSNADFRTAFAKEMIGATVLTSYNNKTYRVDDIDWNSNPMSTFETKNGPVTYVDYYKKRYNIEIRDKKQPLMVSKSKARDLRGGQNEMVSLIPELCRATGLTDEMRSNFRLMRAMADHTRLPPRGRIERLLKFNQRLQESKDSSQVMAQHNLALDRLLVRIGGRMLPQEKMLFGQGTT